MAVAAFVRRFIGGVGGARVTVQQPPREVAYVWIEREKDTRRRRAGNRGGAGVSTHTHGCGVWRVRVRLTPSHDQAHDASSNLSVSRVVACVSCDSVGKFFYIHSA